MKTWVRNLLLVAGILAVAYGAYAAFVTVSNGNEKHVTILAGIKPGGEMFYHCVVEESTPGVCTDKDGHATVTVAKRDRVTFTVKTDDGRNHSHDFLLEGAPYMMWPAGIEMELEHPSESGAFTAWKTGEYRFVCELSGHEDAGMWGTLVVKDA